MLKVSHFQGHTEHGISAIPLFGRSDTELVKCASNGLLPDVVKYIDQLRPSVSSQYVLVNALGASEWYGCFPAGTLVETSTGEKPIEDVAPGELVKTHRNRFRRVEALTPKPTDELCDMYVQGLPSNLPSLTATPNHELWAITRDEFLRTKRKIVWQGDTSTPLVDRREDALREMEFSWIPISSIRAGDYIAEPYPLEENPLALGSERLNYPEVAFLMGLYAAEGCTATRRERPGECHYAVCVVSSDELGVVNRARSALSKFGYTLYDVENPSTHSVRLEIHWQDFARLCKQHIGTPAVAKKLSGALLCMPREWQRVFFDAYANGDGCVRGAGKEEGTIRCVSASAALLRGMRLLLARQRLVGSISGRHNTKATWYNGNPIYELMVSGGQLRGRGANKSYLHPDGYILSAVKKVKQYDWSGEVYDLTVAEDSSFVASGIAVHNSNVNGDAFSEAGLIHIPDNWTGVPAIDMTAGKKWDYGFPTFYGAHPYAHHRNKDPGRAFGEVELATWNKNMRRVELVVRIDHDKCNEFGGVGVWDKIRLGEYPDVSMGTKVPFDTCVICLDWDRYREAMTSPAPSGAHMNTGRKILYYHKKWKAKDGVGIRGLSITRKDYCEHAKNDMNKILPDGRKVWVNNDYPRFFDISFVFIGADKTAKVMLFVFRNGSVYSVKPSAEVAEDLGVSDDVEDGEKAASISDELLKAAFGKMAKPKRAAIEKDVVPSQFTGRAVPVLTKCEDDVPRETLDGLSSLPLSNVLSTLTGMGMLLRPREFQRITLIQLGKRDLADDMDAKGEVFPKSESSDSVDMGEGSFSPSLAELLLPLLLKRSGLGPIVEKRVVAPGEDKSKEATAPLHSAELMEAVGSAYNGYRQNVMELVAHSQDLLGANTTSTELNKLASVEPEEIFTALSVAYLQTAYMDEFGVSRGGVVKL